MTGCYDKDMAAAADEIDRLRTLMETQAKEVCNEMMAQTEKFAAQEAEIDRLRAELAETRRGAKDAQSVAEHWTHLWQKQCETSDRLRARIDELEGITKDQKELQVALGEEIDRLRAEDEA